MHIISYILSGFKNALMLFWQQWCPACNYLHFAAWNNTSTVETTILYKTKPEHLILTYFNITDLNIFTHF